MMLRDDASEHQVRAADPARSTWLLANAGSGKTRVLTDRVARLLLNGTEPQRILCLTYTKAAASEMQNRLFRRLGEWAMLPEDALRAALAELGEDAALNPSRLAQARRLFARAIEAPGGLKIQTIHSFCAGLLRRFPLEAGVAPDFTEMDERAATLLRDDIVEQIAASTDHAALDALAAVHSGEDLTRILDEIGKNSAAFATPLTESDARLILGLPADFTPDDALRIAFDGTETVLLADAIPILARQSKTMVDLAALLRRLDPARPTMAMLESLFTAFLYQSDGLALPSAKVDSIPTKKAQEAMGGLAEDFRAWMLRVADARMALLTEAAARKTLALHRFAQAFLPRYLAAKAARGWLDFDDLITRAGSLLSDRSVAQWVLFRLDGGIDHILIDEAQDTSPGQWAVIERLSEEFTAGEGARGQDRTIFVVGDQKQSIYSFQGADLRAFDRMKSLYLQKFDQTGPGMQTLILNHSFRSSEAILRVVDATLDEGINGGLRGLGGAPRHEAFKTALPGRVDLWAPVPKSTNPEPGDWTDPVDVLPPQNEIVILAEKIARHIRKILDEGTRIVTKSGEIRALNEGDVLILVRRRSDLFAEIIRACKRAGLAIAGADRLKLGAELAVRDLAALLSFLATPEDDLSLATTLRSPLFGWSEDRLFRLAHGRGPGEFLWSALRGRDDCTDTLPVLNDLRDQADYLRPFDLIERALTRHDGRRKLLSRLGPEAEDGIDELLSQALAFERAGIPSLTGFLVWLETDEVTVKRRLESGGKAIRVMTVHGAKGLEAPVVILPDTAVRPINLRDELYMVDDRPFWKMGTDENPPRLQAEREAMIALEQEERMRLLYVAMTRAESWLIVCAAGKVGEAPADSWYAAIAAGMRHAGAAETDVTGAAFDFGPGLRLEQGAWPHGTPAREMPPADPRRAPAWTRTHAPTPIEPDLSLSPSDLGGAKALAGTADEDGPEARLFGTHLHLLLENLPNWPHPDWPDITRTLLASAETPALSAEIETILDHATRVLQSDALQAVLPGSRAEVPITGRIAALGGRIVHGTIDRLLVTPDRVLAVDYKSNRTVPAGPAAVPEGILRQMGAYADLLGQIYPDRPVDTAIFWTSDCCLMPLPPDMVRAALLRATIP